VQTGDGAALVAAAPDGRWDAVIVDAPDPVGHASVLFGEAFYEDCRRTLAPDGVLAVQSDSPYIMPGTVAGAVHALEDSFPAVGVCWAVVPTYAGNLWTFTVATLGSDPSAPPDSERAAELEECRYWSPALHQSAFVLPAFVERQLAVPAETGGPGRT
jgi:spermidine synthase